MARNHIGQFFAKRMALRGPLNSTRQVNHPCRYGLGTRVRRSATPTQTGPLDGAGYVGQAYPACRCCMYGS